MKELGHLVTFLVVAIHLCFHIELHKFSVGFVEGISKESYGNSSFGSFKAQERGLHFWGNLWKLPHGSGGQSR